MGRVKFKGSRVVRENTVTLTSEDTDSTKLFVLPNKARILAWIVNVRTAFSGGTTDLKVGTAADDDYFLEDVSIAAQGWAAPGTALKKPGEVTTDKTAVYAKVGAGNSEGEVRLTCLYSLEQETPIR